MIDKIIITKDSSATLIEDIGKNCKRCGNCCSYGSGIVLNSEIKNLSLKFKISDDEFKEKYLEPFECFSIEHFRFKRIKEKNKPYGKCIFLNEKNLCSIHEVKPLYCRIGNCGPLGNDVIQWFHLNNTINLFKPQSIREWDIYCKNNKVISGGKTADIVNDKEMLSRILNYDILK